MAQAKDPRTKAVIKTAPPAEVKLLAAKALAVLAEQASPRPSRITERLRRLSDNFIAEDPEQWQTALRKIQNDGISGSDIIDHLLPEASRLLGERWMDSEISFAEVSIGSARMQEAVRTLRIQEGPELHAPAKTKVLMIVPRPEHHTLGVFIAADQLRRFGADVSFSVAPHPRQVVEVARNGRFSMIGITVSGRRTLASVKELVETIRANVLSYTPIMIGGPVTQSNLDVKALTDVDYIVEDSRSAAEICGLLAPQGQGEERPQSGENGAQA